MSRLHNMKGPRKLVSNCDILWLGLNGLTVDVELALSGAKARKPFSIQGTLKIEPSLIPFVDRKLIRVLNKYGGWTNVMSSAFEPTESFYSELLKAGYDRQRFDKSRAYLINPAAYSLNALGTKKDI